MNGEGSLNCLSLSLFSSSKDGGAVSRSHFQRGEEVGGGGMSKNQLS